MTTELALTIALGLLVALSRAAVVWWATRTPIGLVNHELARARARRRRR